MALRLFCTFIDVQDVAVPDSARTSRYVATLLERSATKFCGLSEVKDAEGEKVETLTVDPPEDTHEHVNVGSVGHPMMCRRPCARFVKGECTSGADCNYCHLQHEGAIMSLDKRQRKQIQNMDLADLVAMLLPPLRAALAELPTRPAGRLLAAVQAQAAAQAPVPDCLLERRLRRMSLPALLSCIPAQHGDFRAVLQEHIDEIRREMPVTVSQTVRCGTF
ncbi:unnamed protein product [Durusdinium trenchii]|uniref:C3H1-type domain-containing protein n=1 Tax=Durusdinium trenchii TaxID=1381693 RepID=A0ABP0HRP2_9DINO